jgi:hypothetical protein
VCVSHLPFHVTCPAHLTFLDFIILIMLGEGTKFHMHKND